MTSKDKTVKDNIYLIKGNVEALLGRKQALN